MKTFMGFERVFLVITLWTEALSLPFRSFAPRSVPGRLRISSDPESIKDYLNNYLEMFKQHQLRNRQYPYTIPEYEPVYQQGYLSRRPEISPETIAALLPYLYQSDNNNDYSYDYNSAPSASNSYNDDEGVWYDDVTSPDLSASGIDAARDKNNQEAALLQLFLDHLAGKYSLEDLETIERQAAIEDNTENQLQALMPRKKSRYPLMGSRSLPRNFIALPERQGQKEEALVVPASSVRKPVFLRNSPKPQKVQSDKHSLSTKVPTGTNLPTPEEGREKKRARATTTTTTTTKTSSKAALGGEDTTSTTATPAAETASSLKANSSTMEPAIKSAYEAFLAYLDQERFLRKTADEAKHSPQKRFVSDPKSLTQQLASLKKNVT